MPDGIAQRLVESTETESTKMNEFIEKRLNSEGVSFWEPVKNLKIQTFDYTVKKVTLLKLQTRR